MGRYYHNQFGEEGKFWFAVQPSEDPVTVFGGADVTDKSDEDGFDEDYADYDIDDAEYVKKASIWLDIKIFFQTALFVFRADGNDQKKIDERENENSL